MRMKRFAAFLIVVTMIFSNLSFTAHADDYKEKQLKICFNGVMFKEDVLVDGKGKVYAPLLWLEDYGYLQHNENDERYDYFYAGQEELKKGSRRIFINKKDRGFSISVYIPTFNDSMSRIFWKQLEKDLSDQEWLKLLTSGVDTVEEAKKLLGIEDDAGFTNLYEGKFSAKFNKGKQVWVPVEELLPLLGYDVTIADGTIYMKWDAMSIWYALYESPVGTVSFDAEEDMWGSDFLSKAGYVVDTAFSFRIDRFDVVWNSGAIRDYEKVFKSYLVDDEAYLSAFNTEDTPISNQMKHLNQFFGDSKKLRDLYKNIGNWDDQINMRKAFGEYVTFAEVSDGVKGAAADGLVGGIVWSFDYLNTYTNQIEDHRKMLMTVYDYYYQNPPEGVLRYEVKNDWPSYQAAKNIEELYNKATVNTAKVVKEGIKDTLGDLSGQALVGAIFGKMNPYTLTMSVTKTITELTGDYAPIDSGALLDCVNNSSNAAYEAYMNTLFEREYDAETLDDLRLMAIMTLVSAKYAYVSYWGETSKKDEIQKVNEMLTNYYLAAEGIENDGTEFYKKTYDALKKKVKSLTLTEKKQEESTGDKNQNNNNSNTGSTNTGNSNTGNTTDKNDGVHVITEAEAKSCISCYADSWYCYIGTSEDGQTGTARMDTTYEISVRGSAPFEVQSVTVVSATINGTPIDVYQTQDPEKIKHIYEMSGYYEMYGEDFVPDAINIFLVKGTAENVTITGASSDEEYNDNFGAECEYVITVDVFFANGQKVRVSYVKTFLSGWCGGPMYSSPEDYQ